MDCVQGYGESCGRLGFLYCKACSDARTYLGIEIWTIPFSQSHFSDIPMYNFPYQSVVTLYIYLSAAFRCKACYFPEYSRPKSSTTKVKFIGRLLCLHSLGFLLEGWYPYVSRCFTRSLCDIRPAWGIKYILFVTLVQLYPLFGFSARIHFLQILWYH